MSHFAATQTFNIASSAPNLICKRASTWAFPANAIGLLAITDAPRSIASKSQKTLSG
jgi:hypothetical protein